MNNMEDLREQAAEDTVVKRNDGEKPFLSEDDIKALRENTLKEFRLDDQNFFIHICQIRRLHPLANQIWARPEREERSQDGKWKKMIIVSGIQGFLTIADRSGVYDGSSPIEWCGKNGEWVDVWLQNEPPFAARASTWRKDHTRPEVAVVLWKAVANTTWKSERNFWIKMPDHMIGKCALAASLRKLFPNELSGIYETSEIGGGVPDMMEIPQSALEADIAAQKQRIAESEAARERLETQGIKPVESKITAPRDAAKEVEPAFPADKVRLEEPDDLDMTPATEPERDPNWWRTVTCNQIKNQYYNGKTVEDLSHNLLRQAVEKWVPKVRAKGADAAEDYKDLADALEIGLAEVEKAQAKIDAYQAAKAAEGAQ